MSRLRAAIFDLDGVVRHFDRAGAARIAQRHGVTLHDMLAAAFEDGALHALITGKVRRGEWVEAVGRKVGSPAAVREWLSDIGTVDPAVMDLVHALRRRGVLVGILTNGTDTIDRELRHLGIHADFDRVVSTWHVGYAKPHRNAYLAACSALGVRLEEAFFTDDREVNVLAASELGMTAHPFVDAEHLEHALVRAFRR
ncbi:MAG: HAD-IA family hydrolase [Myxococcota bacterium]